MCLWFCGIGVQAQEIDFSNQAYAALPGVQTPAAVRLLPLQGAEPSARRSLQISPAALSAVLHSHSARERIPTFRFPPLSRADRKAWYRSGRRFTAHLSARHPLQLSGTRNRLTDMFWAAIPETTGSCRMLSRRTRNCLFCLPPAQAAPG